MANASALPRNSVGLCSSNDFDGIVERIDNLRLSCETGQKVGSADRGESIERRHKWNVALDNEKENYNDNDNDSDRGGNRRVKDDNGNEEKDADRTDRLIARGPMKSQFLPRLRESPYDCAYASQPIPQPPRTNEACLIDYEETAEQILRDEESTKWLTACLDQLQANAEFNFDSPCIKSDGAALLEKLLRGDLQSAQNCSSLDVPATIATDVAATPRHSSSDNSDSNCLSCAEYPWTQKRWDRTRSPVGSPAIVAAATTGRSRPSRLSPDLQNCYSLSSCSSASSASLSSNQSCGEAYSPNGFWMVNGIVGSRIEETVEDLDNSFWNYDSNLLEENGDRPDAVESVESVDDASKCDAIDSSELQLVEEVLRDLGEEKRGQADQEQRRARRSIEPQKIAAAAYRTDSDAVGPAYEVVRKCDRVPEYGIPDIDEAIARTVYRLDAVVPNYATEKNVCLRDDATTDGYRDGSTRAQFSSFSRSFVGDSLAVRTAPKNADGIEAQLYFAERQRKRSFGEYRTTRSTGDRDDPRIPKTVACFESTSSPRTRRNPDSDATPWPLLKLPSVKASERLKDAVDPKEVERAMRCLLKWSPKEIARQDEDGYTTLMCLVGNPEEIARKSAYLAPLVERTPRDVLACTNDRDQDALYLAALNCPQYSYVAGYLAATMLQKGIDVSQKLYNTRGNTLIHLVAGQGDSHAEIMGELLALRTTQGNRVFDLSKRNYDGKTALHVAIESHEPFAKRISSVATVRLLLECGADPRIEETKCGDSALHTAVSLTTDPELVKVLLENRTTAVAADLANAVNYNRDTPLHAAATVSNNVPVERQKEVFRLLVQAGGYTNQPNRQGKVPLALVAPQRKAEIKRAISRRSCCILGNAVPG